MQPNKKQKNGKKPRKSRKTKYKDGKLNSCSSTLEKGHQNTSKPEQASLDVTTQAIVADDLTTEPSSVAELEEPAQDLLCEVSLKLKGDEVDSKDYPFEDDKEALFHNEIQDILYNRKNYLVSISPLRSLSGSKSPALQGGHIDLFYLNGIEQWRYEDVHDRLVTYASPSFRCNSMTASELSSAGFIYSRMETKNTDQVLCIWCGLTLWQFADHVNAFAIHQAYDKGNCSFLSKHTHGE